ncbi:MAG TPA: ATP-binding protein [Oscillatoriaceae cyanobacterium M33_DOE_052]|uniref:ATP-binding protein n=1 Tax=Planktothricoides sp. SpSt-374 TaxID=2282167 RepID=A0A7C3VPU2_9CYAN|nr:ATP-binding protein [Oscillatoriaceae cyanobacterium M33_DOE_052]
MALIDELIRQEVNPFDINLKPGNFWREKQEATETIDSIHQEAMRKIEGLLDRVVADRRSRTLLLTGDPGSGKSYLLGRLKRTLNAKAFFAYIEPWPEADRLGRHILRYTVDSLMQVPEGQTESQLILWLKSLSVFTKRSLKRRLFDDNFWEVLQSDRQKFINHLKKTYKNAGIYNADSFFGALHDLTEPQLYDIACQWLKGDDLSEESLTLLQQKKSLDSETDAWETLANLGRIATETQPIVLCFDQLEFSNSDTQLAELQKLFSFNTNIHNQGLKNFLIIICLTTNNWQNNHRSIQQSDLDRVEGKLSLKPINLDQAEALWQLRLQPLHRQASPQPDSQIFPLTRTILEDNFPGGKTDPRKSLILGRQEYQQYKSSLGVQIPNLRTDIPDNSNIPQPQATLPELFKLTWQQEFKKIEAKITKVSLLSAPELVQMLAEALQALQITTTKSKLLSGKYASSSLTYQHPRHHQDVGVLWTEDANMSSFATAMKACQKAIKSHTSHSIILIRATETGNNPNLVGYKLYHSIFTGHPNRHILPAIASVHYLATYHSLVNSALGQELLLGSQIISLPELKHLMRESEILTDCLLLQDLGIFQTKTTTATTNPITNGATATLPDKTQQQIQDYLLNVVKTQHFLGKNALLTQAQSQFSETNQQTISQEFDSLIKAGKFKIANPHEAQEKQVVCLLW